MRNNSNRLFKRLMVLFAGIIGVFGLSSCTKTFTTVQDQANQLFAYYGNLYSESVDLEEDTTGYSNTSLQNTNREALFNSLTENQGYSTIDKKFLNYMNARVEDETNETYVLWTDGSLAKENDETAKQIAQHVAIYAGLNDETNKVDTLFANLDSWYKLAVNGEDYVAKDGTTYEAPGVLYSPSAGYIAKLKNNLITKVSTLRAGYSPESRNFTHGGSTVYIEGKTWGQAFAEYGFLEGLFVYPFGWLVHQISTVDLSNGWWQILAIVVITVLARSLTVVSTYIQTKTQAKQQRIQPLLNQLQKKYPNSQTDLDQRRALAMEQSQIMKRNKVHPLLPMLFLILQFPLFLCVWASLQDSAALASGNWLGLSLTTVVSTCFTNFSTTNGALTGVFIFILMTVANILASATSLFFNTWRTKNFGTVATQMGPDGKPVDPNKSMKWMTIIMSVFIVFMGWNLPAGMGIYWLLGSLISIFQTLIMELIQTKNRHKFAENTGDGSTLAAVRRSKHHSSTKAEADKKASKKNKSDKPMWR